MELAMAMAMAMAVETKMGMHSMQIDTWIYGPLAWRDAKCQVSFVKLWLIERNKLGAEREMSVVPDGSGSKKVTADAGN